MARTFFLDDEGLETLNIKERATLLNLKREEEEEEEEKGRLVSDTLNTL